MTEEYLYICNLEKIISAMNNIMNNHSMDETLLKLHNGRKFMMLNQINKALDDKNINLFYELSTELNTIK